MSVPKRRNTMNDLIQALKLCVDGDGHLSLDRDQTTFFLFVLYELMEQEQGMKDAMSVKFAIEDFMGVMPDEKESA